MMKAVAPPTNKGESLDSWSAGPLEYEDQKKWRERLNIDVSKQIRVVELAHMRYMHVDIDKITQFLLALENDKKIWWKGYGKYPYVYVVEKGDKPKFLGGTFRVESYAELEKAAKLPGATTITALDDEPWGGHMVTVYDPVGYPINLMYGQTMVEVRKEAIPPPLAINFEDRKERRNAFQRFTQGLAAVHKLGHYGICYKDYDQAFDFYVRTFNLVPSDIVYAPEGDKKVDVAAFLHIDLGEEFTDHHTFFMGASPRQRVHHCSFEVHDFDTQLLGHQWLERKGYKTVWGVGRHYLGSQIFDYWWDTTGFMIEHYADGDLVNCTTKVGKAAANDEALSVWGPNRPIDWIK
ncbi:trihydroxytoluene oxygenase [Cladophialophora carrionii]|uniref:Trihydroxytoluene oxygenase n=1 Tax=Cladophialophora carrionii TaxID=86049 RepID=A0A1C1CLQ9_9EURO|nr:trihydroxytoluene oxygenase [Cladophialophora carrionii]